MSTFLLKIYTSEKPFFEGECESLIVPTSQGLFGIMARHENVVATLTAGELRYRKKDENNFEHVAIAPGILTVTDNEVVVLTEAAERASDIDFTRAMRQYENAKAQLDHADDAVSRRMAEAKLSRALNRLKVRSGLEK